MRNIDIKEVVDWILKNRSKEAFKDYPPNKIAGEILGSLKHNCFRLETNFKEEIIGVVCAEKFPDAKCILLHDILTTHPDAAKRLWQRYLQTYPDWTLVFGKRGKMRTFYKPKEVK